MPWSTQGTVEYSGVLRSTQEYSGHGGVLKSAVEYSGHCGVLKSAVEYSASGHCGVLRALCCSLLVGACLDELRHARRCDGAMRVVLAYLALSCIGACGAARRTLPASCRCRVWYSDDSRPVVCCAQRSVLGAGCVLHAGVSGASRRHI